jgi:hypothetical protein
MFYNRGANQGKQIVNFRIFYRNLRFKISRKQARGTSGGRTLHILEKYLLAAPVIQFCGPAVSVAGQKTVSCRTFGQLTGQDLAGGKSCCFGAVPSASSVA